jgi:hypothetical protein
MSAFEALVGASRATLVRGMVVDVAEGRVRVVLSGDDGDATACQVLATGAEAPRYEAGDRVLVWLPDEGEGVVLGAVREAPPAAEEAPAGRDGLPDTLVLEARKNLVLKVGDGSIVLREDGKIVIRGKDLISRATRMNRIKGGAVAVN